VRHRTVRLPVPAAATGVLTALCIVLPLERGVRLERAARIVGLHSKVDSPPCSEVVSIRHVAADDDRVDSLRLQSSRVVRVRGIVMHMPVEHVASIRLDALRVDGIRYETPPATPFGYPDRPLRRNSEEALRARMPGTAIIVDDIVRHFGRPARICFAEAGHVIEAVAA